MHAPQRIASLLSSATEILFGLGLGERVVGVSHECDYPSAALALPRLTFSRIDSAADSRAIDTQVRSLLTAGEALYGIDVDLLERLTPDLIITQAQCDVCAVRYADVLATVARSGILCRTPVLDLNPRSLADVFVDVGRVAHAAGVEDAGHRFVAELTARVDAVRRRTTAPAPVDRPRVALLEWIDPPFLAANWMPELLDWAGGIDLGLSVQGEHSAAVRWDQIVARDPEVIVIMPCGFDLARTLDESRRLPEFAGWHDLSAVRSGRVYAVDGNAYFNRSGPRLVDSLELLAHLVDPSRHPVPLDLQAGTAWQQLD